MTFVDKKDNKILCVSYIHPEYYPPTLNAIGELSKIFDSVLVLFRAHKKNEWIYAPNVKLTVSGKSTNLKTQETAKTFNKVFWFLQFTFDLYNLVKSQKPKYVLLYDPIPLFAFWLIKGFCSKDIKVWYHNHDIAEISKVRKYSIGWFATKYESRMFPYLDIFTLPSEERKQYFPMEKLKGSYFFLPNYPTINFYSKFTHDSNIIENQPIKLIYQGNVSKGHGLELIVSILGAVISGHNFELHIAGKTSEEMKQNLNDIAGNYKAKIIFHGRLSYSELPKLTSSCHIGLAINEPTAIIYQTGGSASNKIYEYVACGLPILYLDDEHYNSYLGKYSWAKNIILQKESVKKALTDIINNYTTLSIAAKSDFTKDLNYEAPFLLLSTTIFINTKHSESNKKISETINHSITNTINN